MSLPSPTSYGALEDKPSPQPYLKYSEHCCHLQLHLHTRMGVLNDCLEHSECCCHFQLHLQPCLILLEEQHHLQPRLKCPKGCCYLQLHLHPCLEVLDDLLENSECFCYHQLHLHPCPELLEKQHHLLQCLKCPECGCYLQLHLHPCLNSALDEQETRL